MFISDASLIGFYLDNLKGKIISILAFPFLLRAQSVNETLKKSFLFLVSTLSLYRLGGLRRREDIVKPNFLTGWFVYLEFPK